MILDFVLIAVGVYALVGVVFGVAFSLRGAGRIDPVALTAPIGFRLLVLPGSAALWPYLLKRWINAPAAAPANVPATSPAAPSHETEGVS